MGKREAEMQAILEEATEANRLLGISAKEAAAWEAAGQNTLMALRKKEEFEGAGGTWVREAKRLNEVLEVQQGKERLQRLLEEIGEKEGAVARLKEEIKRTREERSEAEIGLRKVMKIIDPVKDTKAKEIIQYELQKKIEFEEKRRNIIEDKRAVLEDKRQKTLVGIKSCQELLAMHTDPLYSPTLNFSPENHEELLNQQNEKLSALSRKVVLFRGGIEQPTQRLQSGGGRSHRTQRPTKS